MLGRNSVTPRSNVARLPPLRVARMTRTLLDTRTSPDSVTGQVAQPSARLAANQRRARL